jgi:SAM-dependent methyltransferase
MSRGSNGARYPELVQPRPSWSAHTVRHAFSLLKQGRNPAATVYDSLGADFFLALDQGWLNLGLWEGDGGDPEEAPVAVRRLVELLARDLPRNGDVLDVGNGLAAQDPLIASVSSARSLTALNITWSQLAAGRGSLAEAGAHGVNGDATRMPFDGASFDGLISVEAAFHFPSRTRFFAECFRVLRPGGIISMSDIPTERFPRGPVELQAALTQLRVWGLGSHAAATSVQIADALERAGFIDVHAELVGVRTIQPAVRFVRDRLDAMGADVPLSYRVPCRIMLAQIGVLWERGVIDYLLLRARKP